MFSLYGGINPPPPKGHTMPTTIVVLAPVSTKLAVSDLVANDITVLDGMMAAQRRFGQITWTDLTATVAKGTFSEVDADHDDDSDQVVTTARELRVVVVDADNADSREAIEAALWVTTV